MSLWWLALALTAGAPDGVEVALGYGGVVWRGGADLPIWVALPPGRGTATVATEAHPRDTRTVTLGAAPVTCWLRLPGGSTGSEAITVRWPGGQTQRYAARRVAEGSGAHLELRRSVGPVARPARVGPNLPLAAVEPSMLPPGPALWRGCARLVLREFIPAPDSPLGVTMAAWVRAGGEVVLVGGDGLRGACGGFELLRDDAVTPTDRAALRARYHGDGWGDDGPRRLTVARVPDDADVALCVGGRALLARRALGRGQVVFLAAGWANSELWREALAAGPDGVRPMGGLTIWATTAAGQAPSHRWSLPNAAVVLALLYLVVVTAVPAWMARRRARREEAWGVALRLAACGSVVVGGLGLALGGVVQRVDCVSQVWVTSGQRQGPAETVVGLYSPRARRATIVLPATAMSLGDHTASSEDQGLGTRVRYDDDRVTVSNIPLRAWHQHQHGYRDAHDLGGCVELHVERHAAGVRGQVTSRLPFTLRNVALTAGDRAVEIGELPPGATVGIDTGATTASRRPAQPSPPMEGDASPRPRQRWYGVPDARSGDPGQLARHLGWSAANRDLVDTGRVVLSGWHDRTALPPGLRAAAKVVTHRLVVCVTALPRPAPGVGLPVRVAAGLPLGRRWSVTQWSDQRPAGGSGPRVAGAAEGGAPLQTASEGQRLLLPYALSAAPSHRLEIVVSVPPPPPPPPPPPGLPPPNEDPPAAAVEEPGRGPAVYDVVADRWEAIPARSGSDGRARWATTAVARYVTADRVIRLRDCGHRAWLTVTQIVGLRL